jgi:HTH-type transcriptional regulator/antitoxin HigA
MYRYTLGSMGENLFNIDELLQGAFKKEALKDIFENKLDELKLTKTSVQEILGIPYRTLKGVLEGTQKVVDVMNLIKLADFLQMPKEEVFRLYTDALQKRNPMSRSSPDAIRFIQENFDPTVLKKAGLIDDVSDYHHIEQRIVKRLGFKSIFEYQKPSIDVAFSSGLFKPKNLLTRLFWIRVAICRLEEMDNPNDFNKDILLKYIPHIRQHTMNVSRGLTEVVRALYKIGITVIFQPPLQGLQLRGATFNVNDRPCIVLTNYRGFYSTLWFCLMHEIFHVVFDWKDIKENRYHLTDDDVEELTVQEREKEADKFASDYLFSKEKLATIKSKLNNEAFVKGIAKANDIHESMIYSSYAFETNDRKAWARAKATSPPVETAIRDLDFAWNDTRPFEEIIAEHKRLVIK